MIINRWTAGLETENKQCCRLVWLGFSIIIELWLKSVCLGVALCDLLLCDVILSITNLLLSLMAACQSCADKRRAQIFYPEEITVVTSTVSMSTCRII